MTEGKRKRSGGTAADVQDEILAAACNALDKAHALLSFVVRYEGKCTPQFVEKCREWVDGEYDPGERLPKQCDHVWVKTALGHEMFCTLCRTQRNEGCQ